MDQEPQRPELVRTGTAVGWKLPALAVAAVLIVLVALTRTGGSPLPAPTTGPESAVAQPTLHLGPTSVPTRPPTIHEQLTGLMSRSADGKTYADGIPTNIDGAAVYRVHDVQLMPFGRKLLIGGWYRPPRCRANGPKLECPSPTMSDVPLVPGQGDVRTDFVALDTRLSGTGAYVVLARVVADPDCSIHVAGLCQPRLKVLQQTWSGPG